MDRGGRPGPLGAPRSFSPPRPRGPREAGQKRRKPRAGCRRGRRRGGSDDSAAGSAGPPGSRRRRRRRRCGPQDPRTPHPATAPPSSGAAAEGSPAATTHGPVTSGVARRTSRPALSCARSPPPVGSGTRRGRALAGGARSPRAPRGGRGGASPRLRSGWLRPRTPGGTRRLSPAEIPGLCSHAPTCTSVPSRLPESLAPRRQNKPRKWSPAWASGRARAAEQEEAATHFESIASRLQAKRFRFWIWFQHFFLKDLRNFCRLVT